MKILTCITLALLTLVLHAQKIEKFYNYQWKECEPGQARFYGTIEKIDSGWRKKAYFLHSRCLFMDGTYEDSSCKIANGTFRYFYPDRRPDSLGVYKHNLKQGTWLSYYSNGMMSDSASYSDGKKIGVNLGWYPGGNPRDSSNFTPDGNGVVVGWFDNGTPSFSGRYINWRATGQWQFFHQNGKISALELYNNGILAGERYLDESGNIAVASPVYQPPFFNGGQKGWLNYLSKNLTTPHDYGIANADSAVAVITFTIDENGKVQDVYASIPFAPPFDNMAINIIKRSPKWTPAIDHNRPVRSFYVQAVNFVQLKKELL